ncbi:MAG TPA: two-component regulator propeller domain-containing protein, partial [Bacteroidota bacterium]|nr:two-component regulator propeller domain-containing protein [Bacteroidota bacterium]
QYGQNIWLRKNGLPANTANTVIQTRDGYLWAGTSAGLFRFDGVNFTKINLDTLAGKKNEVISTLLETRDGSLWVGTGYNGLRRIREGKVMRYGLKEGFKETQVLSLFEARSGNLWIGTSNGAYIFSDGKFLPVSLNTNYILSVAQDDRGKIWLGTHRGVRVVEDRQQSDIVSLTTSEGLPDNSTSFVYVDRRGIVWIGTADGLVRWNQGSMKVLRTGDGLSDNHVMSALEDKDGNLWFGTNKGGLDRFSRGRWSSFLKSDGLTDPQVVSISEDNEGSVWVCTADGLNQFEDVSVTTLSSYDGLASDYLSSVIETSDRSLYFLSDQGSSITRLRDERFTRIDMSVGPAYAAKDGSLWIGQTGVLNNIKGGRTVRFGAANGIPPTWISAISEDDTSIIFHADRYGIYRFKHGKLSPFLVGGHEYPFTGFVSCFYPAKNGVMWIGTGDSLVRIEDGQTKRYTMAEGMAGNWVSSIYDDGEGNLWVSSPQGGLSRFRDGRFTKYTTEVGLFADEIYSIVGDNEGGLWLGSPNGIGYVNRKELIEYAEGKAEKIHSKIYTTEDGLKTNECFGTWQPAGWKAMNGDVWFATKRGAVRIDPRAFRWNQKKPPVFIEQVSADQQPVASGGDATLPPGTDKLEIHYTALSYLVPERVHFRYKLEGYDKEWIDAGTRRVAYYNGLPARGFRFRVMASNNDGIWNEEGASFSFSIRPYFYQTYWFAALLVLTVIAFGLALYQIRVLSLVRHERELEARIQEAMANIKVLGGLIPICSNCKKIRNDKGYWDLLEGYIQQHSEAKFSHGLCPDCAKLLYPDVFPPKDEA